MAYAEDYGIPGGYDPEVERLIQLGISPEEAQQIVSGQQSGVPEPPQAPSAPSYQYQSGVQFDKTSSPKEMSENDRGLAQWQGDVLNQDNKVAEENNNALSTGYRNWGDEVAGSMINNGGYTPEEAANIKREEDLNGLQLSGDEANAAYWTPEEQAGVQGNPNAQRGYFDPAEHYGLQTVGEERTRGAVDQYGNEMNAAIDPSRLRVRDGLPEELVSNTEYTAGNVRDTINPEELNVSQSSLDTMRMSPQEYNDAVTAAGISVGNRYRADVARTDRESRAAGVDPIGAAALRASRLREGAEEAGDAAVQARVAAGASRAGREAQAEGMRVGYGQNLAALRSSREMALGQERGRALEAGENLRLSGERDVSNRQMGAASEVGAARLGNERYIDAGNKDTARYVQGTGMAMERDIDTTNAERAKALAANRQNTTLRNQDARFSRGYAINQTASNRAAGVADARRGDRNTGLSYVQGQNAQANQNAQNAAQRRVSIYGAQQGARADATRNRIAVEGTPGKGERVLMGFVNGAQNAAAAGANGGGAQGGVFTEPTSLIVAEDGPEAVVPLTGREDAIAPPHLFAGAQPFDTAPQAPKPQAPYSMRFRYGRSAA